MAEDLLEKGVSYYELIDTFNEQLFMILNITNRVHKEELIKKNLN